MSYIIDKFLTDKESLRKEALRGQKGDSIKGDSGLSAYQIWLNEGNRGSKNDFLSSLKGSPGISIKGDKGESIKGDPGKNAIQIKNFRITPDNSLIVQMENGELLNAGKLPKSKDGLPGRGIKDIYINSEYDLLIQLDDGNLINAGKLPKGEPGQEVRTRGGGGGTSRKYVDEKISAIEHNLLSGLQGGALNEYYHLSATKYTFLNNINTTVSQWSNDAGYITENITARIRCYILSKRWNALMLRRYATRWR
jgi:hypothetical protein